jgi:hypothetical protein
VVRAFTESATTEDTASRRSARPSIGAEETEAKARRETRAQQRAAGMKKTALFDMVKMVGVAA